MNPLLVPIVDSLLRLAARKLFRRKAKTPEPRVSPGSRKQAPSVKKKPPASYRR